MKFKMKVIVPEAINQLDGHLLLNYPLLWASRIHYLLFFGFVILFLNHVIFSVVPVGYDYVPDAAGFLVYSIMSGFFLWGVWVYYQSIMNFGFLRGIMMRGHSLGITGIFLSLILILALIFLAPYWVLNRRIVSELVERNSDLPPIKNFTEFPYSKIEPPEYKQAAYVIADSTEITFDPKQLAGEEDYDTIDAVNKDIAQAAFNEYAKIISSFESGLFERKLHNFKAITSNWDLDFEIRDTIIVYYNEYKEKPIHAYDDEVIVRSIKARITTREGWASYPLTAYYFPFKKEEEKVVYAADDIHCSLIFRKIRNNLDEAGIQLDKAYYYTRNLQFAYQQQWDAVWTMMAAMVIVFLTYFAVQISALIKFFGVRPFLISLFTLILTVLILAFLCLTVLKFYERAAFLTSCVVPCVIGIPLCYMTRGKMLLRLVFWQWTPYTLPFVLMFSRLYRPETLFDDLLYLAVVSVILLLATAIGYRVLYKIYSYPSWK